MAAQSKTFEKGFAALTKCNETLSILDVSLLSEPEIENCINLIKLCQEIEYKFGYNINRKFRK